MDDENCISCRTVDKVENEDFLTNKYIYIYVKIVIIFTN